MSFPAMPTRIKLQHFTAEQGFRWFEVLQIKLVSVYMHTWHDSLFNFVAKMIAGPGEINLRLLMVLPIAEIYYLPHNRQNHRDAIMRIRNALPIMQTKCISHFIVIFVILYKFAVMHCIYELFIKYITLCFNNSIYTFL